MRIYDINYGILERDKYPFPLALKLYFYMREIFRENDSVEGNWSRVTSSEKIGWRFWCLGALKKNLRYELEKFFQKMKF